MPSRQALSPDVDLALVCSARISAASFVGAQRQWSPRARWIKSTRDGPPSSQLATYKMILRLDGDGILLLPCDQAVVCRLW